MNKPVNILVVDDEPTMRSLLTKVLTRDGYEVLCAEDGVQALQMLETHPVDLVLSDVKMPRMNGFELLKAIKTDYPDIGVIMMTAYGDTFTVRDALLLRADEYVTKPFRSHEISLVVRRAYWRLQGRSQGKETASAGNTAG